MNPVNLSRIVQGLRSRITPGEPLLLAVSGGPDSVALAHVMRQSPFALAIGHVDHGLRRSSRADAEFVCRLAKSWDLPYYEERVSVRRLSRSAAMSIEEAARHLRYQALARFAKKARARAVLTAHTRDDQAETVLMHFLRGSGGSGLAGIPAERLLDAAQGPGGLKLLRPFLDVSRAEVLAYLKGHRLRVRQDPSNRSRAFTRNRIRLETLPYLARLYPGLADRLVQTASILREEENFWAAQLAEKLSKTVRQNKQSTTIDLGVLFGYHKALGRRILRHFLPGSSFQDIERIFSLAQATAGESNVKLSNGFFVKRRAGQLILQPAQPVKYYGGLRIS